MKKKNLQLSKKLLLIKETLTELKANDQMGVVGGETVTFCGLSCPAQCQPTLNTCVSCFCTVVNCPPANTNPTVGNPCCSISN